MKIGVISDSHDNSLNVEKAFKKMEGVDAVIHCGDLCAPFMIEEFDKFGVDVHIVFGNTDDRAAVVMIIQKFKHIKHHGHMAELDLGGKKIAVTHFPEFGHALACTGKYDAVFYGHTHKKKEERVDKTLLANPGEILGRGGKASFLIYDTEKDNVEFFDLD